jgi:DNA-binding beta-propeller fold protein YncE
MESGRFDALVRLVGVAVTRRGALTALLAGAIASLHSDPGLPDTVAAARRKRRDKGRGERRSRKRGKSRKPHARAEAAACCSTGNCAPGKGKNLSRCCYQGQNLGGKNFQGANLGSANFAGATLTGANLHGANLDKTCLVDATLTGAKINASTNLGTSIFCRTQTDAGENNAGCDKGTPCCPTCDDAHPCGEGEVCCKGRCRECCGNGVQSTCGDGEICCADSCVAGNCCAAADCPTETCQRKSCQNHQCVYEPVLGQTGPRCQTVCCEDAQGEPVCCDVGTTICGSTGRCGCAADGDCDTDAGEICCDGTCRLPGWSNTTAFGSAGTGPTEMLFVEDVAVSADQQTAWAVDNENNRISIWARQPNGSWSHVVNLGGPTAGSAADKFNEPKGVAVAADGKTVWVADLFNDRVSVWTQQPNGSWANQTTFGSPGGSGSHQLSRPFGVDVSADGLRVWVADAGNSRVSIWTRPNATSIDWTNLTVFGTNGSGVGQFSVPRHLAVSSDELTVWVGDRDNNRVSVWTRLNTASIVWTNVTTFGDPPGGSGPSQFNDPQGVAVADDGQRVWVADEDNSRISVWVKTGPTTWANETTFGGNPPGTGLGQVRLPEGVEVSADGLTVYVADTPNDRVSVWEFGCPE